MAWKKRQEFLPLIAMKYLTVIGGRHPRWLRYFSCAVNQPTGIDISKPGQLSSVEKKPLCYPQHRIIESVKLEKTFNVFVIRAQMHKTCCRLPDLEQGS